MTADPTNDGACFLRPVMTSSSRSCEDRLSVFIGDRLITHIATLAPRSSKVCTNAPPNLDQTAHNIDEIVSVYGVLRPTRFFSDVVGSPAKPRPKRGQNKTNLFAPTYLWLTVPSDKLTIAQAY